MYILGYFGYKWIWICKYMDMRVHFDKHVSVCLCMYIQLDWYTYTHIIYMRVCVYL